MVKYWRWLWLALGALAALSAFLVVLFCSIYGVAMDREFYVQAYESYGTYEKVGMTKEDLIQVTEALLVYLEEPDLDSAGVSDILEVSATVHGIPRQVFNDKEIEHMVDVRNLYQQGLRLCLIFAGVLAVLLCFLAVGLWRGCGGGAKGILRWVFRGFWIGCGLGIGFLGGLALWAWLDFSEFWTALHEMVFSNDLWLLDPREDILIQIMQGELFFDMAMRIVLWVSLLWGGMSVAVAVGQYVLRRQSSGIKR
jgi:integral membrane protein (TIGR01906 family)